MKKIRSTVGFTETEQTLTYDVSAEGLTLSDRNINENCPLQDIKDKLKSSYKEESELIFKNNEPLKIDMIRWVIEYKDCIIKREIYLSVGNLQKVHKFCKDKGLDLKIDLTSTRNIIEGFLLDTRNKYVRKCSGELHSLMDKLTGNYAEEDKDTPIGILKDNPSVLKYIEFTGDTQVLVDWSNGVIQKDLGRSFKINTKCIDTEVGNIIIELEDGTLEILKPENVTRTYFIDKVYNKLKPL